MELQPARHERPRPAGGGRSSPATREVWDRCINTSDRTRNEVDLAQRFPMPYRAEVVAKASEIGLDPAYVYGLIRQESRFITDARSSVGASGLMQVMPATARWTAKKIGLPFTADMITDRDTNLRIGRFIFIGLPANFDSYHLLHIRSIGHFTQNRCIVSFWLGPCHSHSCR